MMESTVLFESQGWSIEYYRSAVCKHGLVYTFTPFNFQSLAEAGFGVNYLLQRGFDVVAFKCVDNSWYQGVPLTILQEVAKIGLGYDHVASYGSSMGAYAAIAFSRVLRPDVILAISPQFAIDQEFDRRWAHYANRDWKYRIDKDAIGKGKFIAVYDPKFQADVAHIERIRAAVPKKQWSEFAIPFSGHASSSYLVETGQLQRTVAHLLAGNEDVHFSTQWSISKTSKTYFLFLGRYAQEDGRMKLAEMCFKRSLALAPNHAETWFLLSRLLQKLGRQEEAREVGLKAVELAPKITGFRVHLDSLSKPA